jgi:hypothetical protein
MSALQNIHAQPGEIVVTRQQACAAYAASGLALVTPALLSANAEWLASRTPIIARWIAEDAQRAAETEELLSRLDGLEVQHG